MGLSLQTSLTANSHLSGDKPSVNRSLAVQALGCHLDIGLTTILGFPSQSRCRCSPESSKWRGFSVPGVVVSKQKPATKGTCPWSCCGSVTEMAAASVLKLWSFSLPSASTRLVRSIRTAHDTQVPYPGSTNCLVPLCFRFPVLLVGTVLLSELAALGWLVLQTDLVGVASQGIIHKVSWKQTPFSFGATKAVFGMYSSGAIEF